MVFFHGTKSENFTGNFDVKFSANRGFLCFLTEDYSYAAAYGRVVSIEAEIGNSLDLRAETEAYEEIELPVSAWIAVLAEKGLQVSLLDEDWADVEIPVWHLWADACDASTKTTFADAIVASEFDAVQLFEFGGAGGGSETVGIVAK